MKQYYKKFIVFFDSIPNSIIVLAGLIVAFSIVYLINDTEILPFKVSLSKDQVLGSFSKPTPTLTPTDIPTPTENPTPIPTDVPTQIPEAKPVYVNPDPIISCRMHSSCGGGTRQMKRSECSQSICCQLENTWSIYPNETACDQAQNNYHSSGTSGTSNYPPCTVYYPALKTSSTYSYTSPETCKQWQDAANAGSTNTSQPAQQPTTVPTQDNTEYNNLLKKHEELCKQAVAEWNGIKENWEEANKGKYSSSVEEYSALRQRMAQYQQELYGAGCTQTISLY